MVLDVRSDSGAISKITKPDDHIILQVSGFLIFASEVNVDEGGVARYTRQVDQRRVDDRVRRTVCTGSESSLKEPKVMSMASMSSPLTVMVSRPLDMPSTSTVTTFQGRHRR